MRVIAKEPRFLLFLMLLLTVGCQPRRTFDGQAAYRHVQAQCNLGPRYPGSRGHQAVGDYIIRELQRQKCRVVTQEFDYQGVHLRNIIGKLGEGKGPLVILGAHYDTRRFADSDPADRNAPVLGANDGASGVAVLLELARCLDRGKLVSELWLAFFDAEDQGRINGWPWSVGAQYVADHLEKEPAYVIVVDMIGDAQQGIFWEHSSDRDLQWRIWEIASQLGYREAFIPEYKYNVIDDHTPFLRKGIKAVDLIDLDYPYWHTTQDTPDKVSPESLMRVGRVLEELLE